MQRKNNITQANLILTGDWHLRDDTPLCRTDDFQKTQWNKVEEIRMLQEKHDCPVIHSGDLFNHWKPSPRLLSKTIEHLPNKFYTIYGNHDLPQHNLELADKCGIHTLEAAGKVSVLKGCHWGQQPNEHIIGYAESILVWHIMSYQGRKPWPGCTDPAAHSLIRKHNKYKLIVTGHNHKPFVETFENRVLVNPGSIMRQTSTQYDHKPRVYLWYADTNKVEPVYLQINENAISRDHIILQNERNERIDSFISKLNTDWEAQVSFEENLERFLQTNEVITPIKEIIYKATNS